MYCFLRSFIKATNSKPNGFKYYYKQLNCDYFSITCWVLFILSFCSFFFGFLFTINNPIYILKYNSHLQTPNTKLKLLYLLNQHKHL